MFDISAIWPKVESFVPVNISYMYMHEIVYLRNFTKLMIACTASIHRDHRECC